MVLFMVVFLKDGSARSGRPDPAKARPVEAGLARSNAGPARSVYTSATSNDGEDPLVNPYSTTFTG
jgi:hypothetical protein